MTMSLPRQPIAIFTPSFADEDNTNAQNLTVKEIVARLPADLFRVIMICGRNPDPRIAARENTELISWTDHGNTARLLRHFVFSKPDIYFFPRFGPFDRVFFDLRKRLPVRAALVSYVVMMMNEATDNGLAGRSIVEADQVCANSNYVAESVRQKFGVQSITIHDGVDRRFFFPRRRSNASDGLVVLYAGSFQARKRVELVIEQAARWPNVQFRLAGRGETEEHCRALCRQYSCRNVSFLGHLSSAQLGDEMRQADVFLFPSVLEGHPQVLIQATACGLPSIAMNLYRPDCVLNGKTGFLVQSENELSARLDLLLQNPALRQSMSEAAIQHSHNFDWDQIVEQWMDVFRDVVEMRQKSSSRRMQLA